MNHKPKLELTWIGKDDAANPPRRIELRILIGTNEFL